MSWAGQVVVTYYGDEVYTGWNPAVRSLQANNEQCPVSSDEPVLKSHYSLFKLGVHGVKSLTFVRNNGSNITREIISFGLCVSSFSCASENL